jgi:hypothetical protein
MPRLRNIPLKHISHFIVFFNHSEKEVKAQRGDLIVEGELGVRQTAQDRDLKCPSGHERLSALPFNVL